MSEIKSNKLSPRKGTTQTIGDSGDTITVSSGATLNIQGNYSGINTISWDTTAKTADFTAETNRGYFINTTSASVTITLPASPVAGSFIGIKDYALTADTNSININANGNKIQGSTDNFIIDTEGGAVNLVYVDSTQGWLTFDSGQSSDITEQVLYVTATGGTVTTCGDFKTHVFNSPGTFCVSCAGNSLGSNSVEYLVVAGGASGIKGAYAGPGGGGGCVSTATCLSVTAQGYPITVGAGGTNPNGAGSNSVFSSITAIGGGANPAPPASKAQSGNGLYLGNTASGGNVGNEFASGGGGDAGGSSGRTGGPGTTSSLTGSPVVYSAGGGGAAGSNYGPGGRGSPNAGQGAGGPGASTAGTANTGSGGGGGNCSLGTGPGYSSNASNGGSGVVAIKYKFQN